MRSRTQVPVGRLWNNNLKMSILGKWRPEVCFSHVENSCTVYFISWLHFGAGALYDGEHAFLLYPTELSHLLAFFV